MSDVAIDYDPLKAKLGLMVSRSTLLRRLFYTALGMLFLRQWHVRKELKELSRTAPDLPAKAEGRSLSGGVKDIFDAGSGFGQYSYLMAKFFPGATIYAVDVKQEQIDDCNYFAKQMGLEKLTFAYADLTEFRNENRYDLALSVDVMEHILDDLSVYRNVFASLRPGGKFIIATPSADEAPPSPPGEVHSVIGEHVREGYTKDEFIQKVTNAGFKIVKMKRTYGPVWGRIAWMILQRIPMRLLTWSRLLAVVVVPWMILVYPVAAFAMYMDVHSANQRGGGWLMVVQKPA